MVCGGYHTMALSAGTISSPIIVENIEKKSMNFKIRPITDVPVRIGEEASYNYNPI
jgi:hypothetical protein